MKVLVTGGAGMVGYHVSKFYLDAGHDVTIIDNLSRSYLLRHETKEEQRLFNAKALERMGAKWVCTSIGDPTAFANLTDDYSLIVHLAAQVSVPMSIDCPREDFSVNAIGSFDVLEYARKINAAVVYSSSNKVYPLHAGWETYFTGNGSKRWGWKDHRWHKNGFPIDGHHEFPEWATGSRTPYGQSKYVGDLLCQEWHHTYGVKTGVFRMSCIADTNQFSFSEQGWLVHFVINNLKGLPVKIFGDGCQVRDVLAARDLVKAYDAFFRSDKQHGIYNIGGGPNQAISLNEALDLIEDVTGKDFTDVTYEDWRPLDQRVYTSDISLVKNELGWQPEISIRQIVEEAAQWVEQNIQVF